jgi:hypothetical protein
MVHAAYEGCRAWVSDVTGSWLISNLMSTLKGNSEREQFLDIITEVINGVSHETF